MTIKQKVQLSIGITSFLIWSAVSFGHIVVPDDYIQLIKYIVVTLLGIVVNDTIPGIKEDVKVLTQPLTPIIPAQTAPGPGVIVNQPIRIQE